ncbi:hypothetical protein VC83_08483 [Pseudogymnoascus destructans]|uniref:Uncharacterized protein n=2 Tax=Pseudogymnoascus destructans TaxID=655981 RepID=L8G1S5_PSED2|nr:uncharacterized protein VC83_08483 [Pseudogymnoascus destructans]ELR07072.1 hypothetical protein GMDG_08249 [Pseudogymnoascus destructans 20631-21]OAF55122.1 hypothetical protein VC83_08483 [Pseudogymnoascus destructans]
MSKKPTSNIPQDNDGQLPRMTTRQSTAAAMTAVPSEDIPSRMAHLEAQAQIQEVKDLLVILSASQTRIPSTLLRYQVHLAARVGVQGCGELSGVGAKFSVVE